MGIGIGFLFFAGLSAMVVWGSSKLQSIDPALVAPANLDNRWPGYPLRKGESE